MDGWHKPSDDEEKVVFRHEAMLARLFVALGFVVIGLAIGFLAFFDNLREFGWTESMIFKTLAFCVPCFFFCTFYLAAHVRRLVRLQQGRIEVLTGVCGKKWKQIHYRYAEHFVTVFCKEGHPVSVQTSGSTYRAVEKRSAIIAVRYFSKRKPSKYDTWAYLFEKKSGRDGSFSRTDHTVPPDTMP